MPEPNPKITDQEKQDIQSARKSLPPRAAKRKATLRQRLSSPAIPTIWLLGYDYARYILAEGRFSLEPTINNALTRVPTENVRSV